MRLAAVFVVVLMLTGCAIADTPVKKNEVADNDPFEVIDESMSYKQVEHGIVTVREVQPRSDIAIMPPSVEHVVWQRDGSTPTVGAIKRTEPGRQGPVEALNLRSAVDNWALLEEDMNFQSEIGRVDMCRPSESCTAGRECADVVPCERADELSCHRVKMGDYCVEIR